MIFRTVTLLSFSFALAACGYAAPDPLDAELARQHDRQIDARLAKLEARVAEHNESFLLIAKNAVARSAPVSPAPNAKLAEEFETNDTARRLKALEQEQYLRDQGIRP